MCAWFSLVLCLVATEVGMLLLSEVGEAFPGRHLNLARVEAGVGLGFHQEVGADWGRRLKTAERC